MPILRGAHCARRHTATCLGKTDHEHRINVTFSIRRRVGHEPLPKFEDYITNPPRKRMSEEEFIAKHGADEADIQLVRDYCEPFGLHVHECHAARRHIRINGSVAQLNAAFGIEIEDFEDTDEHGYHKFRSHGPVNLPDHLIPIVQMVSGMDTQVRIKPCTSVSLSPPNTGVVVPSKIKTAYKALPGQATGQTIGIWGWSQSASDIAATLAQWGLTPADTTLIYIDGVGQGSDPSTIGEGNLDNAIATAFAPGAKIAVFFPGSDTNYWADTLGRMIHPNPGDPICQIFSLSFVFTGDVEGNFPQLYGVGEPLLQDAAALGITILVATGDVGASNYATDGSVNAPYPASSPWVTAVGGTVIGNFVGSTFTEWAWFGSGGGVSSTLPKPSYQSGITIPVSLKNNFPGRGTPDISALASPACGFDIVVNGVVQSRAGNGTSTATPTVAGLLAVVNATLGYDLGFLNPIIYYMQNNFPGLHCIRDMDGSAGDQDNAVTVGSIHSPGYPVTSGWDAVTGWGVLEITPFYNYLISQPAYIRAARTVAMIAESITDGHTDGWYGQINGNDTTENKEIADNNVSSLGFYSNFAQAFINPASPAPAINNWPPADPSIPVTPPPAPPPVVPPPVVPPPVPPPVVPPPVSPPVPPPVVPPPVPPPVSPPPVVPPVSPPPTPPPVSPPPVVPPVPPPVPPPVVPPPAPPPVLAESANGTTVTTVGPGVVDALHEVFTITSGQQIAVNGATDLTTDTIIVLAYYNHLVYTKNTINLWFSKAKASDPWVRALDPTQTVTESPNGTIVTTVGPTVVDSFLESFALNSSQQVTVNGTWDGTSAQAVTLAYFNHIVYHKNSSNNWYSKSRASDGWTLTVDPTVVAPPPGPPVSGVPIPAAAQAAGFTNLVFNDDFTTSNQFSASTNAVVTGAKWYYGQGVPNTNWTIDTAAMATGAFASSSGGIIHCVGTSGNSGFSGFLFVTIPNGMTSVPSTGCWNTGYFEAYIKLNPSDNPVSGWPGFWSWSAEANAQGNVDLNTQTAHTEVDFMEYGNGSAGAALHEWDRHGGASSPLASTNIPREAVDGNWHCYSCLWTSNSVSFYFDNNILGSPVPVGVGTSYPSLATEHIYLTISAGSSAPVDVDYVRVWQSGGTPVSPPSPPPVSPPPSSISPSGTTIVSDGTNGRTSGATQIVDSTLVVWTLVTGTQIARNGVVLTETHGVILLLYFNGVIYHQTTSQEWWQWNGSWNFVSGGDPRVVAPPPAPPPTGSIQPPPQAVAAGFTRLVFNDDFTDSSSIASSASATLADNKKWYWSGVNNQNSYTYFTNSHAADIANGNNGGGNFASPNGGIMRLNDTYRNDGGSLGGIPDNYTSLTGNIFQHAYFEAYCQFSRDPPSGRSGWPGFWAWSAEAKLSGQSGIETAEIDFMEYNPGQYQVSPGGHDWNGRGGNFNPGAEYTNNTPNPMDNNWHLYGCLWVSTGNGNGNVKFYMDNVQMTWPNNDFSNGFITGNAAGQDGVYILEQRHLFIALGSAQNGWPVYWDYVRVWQA